MIFEVFTCLGRAVADKWFNESAEAPAEQVTNLLACLHVKPCCVYGCALVNYCNLNFLPCKLTKL